MAEEDIISDSDASFDNSDEEASVTSDFNNERSDMRKAQMEVNRKKRKSGGFQSMGLSSAVLNAVLKKGYKVPTPIQRKTIPLLLEEKDVVAMARTGSGKTAAFLVPMLERLKQHSAKVGVRALILEPSRELAMQTAKFARELGKFTDLRCALIVGGDQLDEQFAQLATNPDVIIATPGRLLHLIVEMNLQHQQLKTVEYVVFDEADRLFEMGFQEAIGEIMRTLPEDRQTALFSATLPKSLAEFARAGLNEPVLVRLDVDSKLSPDLSLAFLALQADQKDAALLYLLQNVINTKDEQTIIFASTKHHVDYLHELLLHFQLPNAYIYGSLDQAARQQNLASFRAKRVNLLVVTDLAARGIDVPLLNNVVHYDFPDKCKLFVHRSGRAARAGCSGTAYSFVTNEDLPYLLDLQLFLGRQLSLAAAESPASSSSSSSPDKMMVGFVPPVLLLNNSERCQNLIGSSVDLANKQKVVQNAMKMYNRTKAQPAKESVGRSKSILEDAPIGSSAMGVHPLLRPFVREEDIQQTTILDQIRQYRPSETIFEFKKMGHKMAAASDIMQKRRGLVGGVIGKRREQKLQQKSKQQTIESDHNNNNNNSNNEDLSWTNRQNNLTESVIIDEYFPQQQQTTDGGKKRHQYRDEAYYIPHTRQDHYGEKALSIEAGLTSFQREANQAQMDIIGDDMDQVAKQRNSLRWDKKKKRFVRDTVGSDNRKRIRTENGTLLPASFKTNRFEEWQKKNGASAEDKVDTRLSGRSQKRFKHTKVTEAKPLDKRDINYEKKVAKRKQRPDQESSGGGGNVRGGSGSGAKSRTSRVKNELKDVAKIKKERLIKQRRQEKNARPSKKHRRR